MRVERTALVNKLKLIDPALSDTGIIPIFTHYAFTGESILAYNDRIALSTPLQGDFKGAVPNRLLALLDSSRAEHVELSNSGGNLNMKASRARITLGILPVEDFVFQMPSVAKQKSVKLPPAFFTAIDDCVQSCVSDKKATVVDQSGVTLIPGDKLSMFSTDGVTMTRVILPAESAITRRMILPADFCAQMLRLYKEDEDHKLIISKDHVLFITDNATLFGRLIESKNPLDLTGVFERHMPKELSKKLVPMPSGLGLVLNRAALVTNIKNEKVGTATTIENEQGHFVSVSSQGEVIDHLKMPKHPAVETSIDATRILDGFDRYQKILFTESCTILARDNTVYLVAAIPKRK